MVKLIVLETKSTEEDLFFNLVSRGRWDLPYYFSVDSYDWSKGIVFFFMLCCLPSLTMKVGVAGNLIVTSEKSIEELKKWLKDWEVKFKQKMVKSFSSPEDAQIFHREMRREIPKEQRQEAGKRIEKRIKDHSKKVDEDLLAMCGADIKRS